MYNFKGSYNSSCPVLKDKTQPIVRAIDSNDGDFVLNKYGHVRSDFAVLTDTNDSVELAKALANMQQMYNENSSQFDGLTFEQMVKAVRPRWCQLPGEVDRFEQYLIDEALDFYNKLRNEEVDVVNDEVSAEAAKSISKPATIGGTSPND